jgi:hypothetical protein
MAAEKDDLFDDVEKEPKVIVLKKLPPQTEAMDLPEKEQKPTMPRKKKEPQSEAPPLAAEPVNRVAEKPAAKPKPKLRTVNISEDTYWAIRKKLVELRKETLVEDVLEEAVRLWIRHKSG